MKTLNIEKWTNSPRGIKKQNELEMAMAQRVLSNINFENAMVIIEKNGILYACKISMKLLLAGLAISGKRAKILCPYGKSQVEMLINNGDMEIIGRSTDLLKYFNNPRYKVSNNGQAVEYFIAQKKHCKFHHKAKMLNSTGEFLNCEVKFFSFDKTSGTPSATFEKLK